MRVENHRTSATTMRIRPAQRPPRRRVRDTPPAAGAAIVAKFDREMLGIYTDNSAAQPGALTLLGTPIDLGRVTCDSCVIAGQTDHITPWMPCYMTSQLLGGETEMIVTSTGHIQTIVNPPGKPRACYFAAPRPGPTPRRGCRRRRRWTGRGGRDTPTGS